MLLLLHSISSVGDSLLITVIVTPQVHFASGPSFLTVHFVGTEERAGTWHHFSLDRERFQRRILDLASILSPVLEADHRAKVLKRNQN